MKRTYSNINNGNSMSDIINLQGKYKIKKYNYLLKIFEEKKKKIEI